MLLILLLIIIVYFIYYFSVNKEHYINYKKCHERKISTLLKQILNIIGSKNDNVNWDLYLPCTYTTVEQELRDLLIKNEDQKIFGISGCDKIVSKNNLWELLEKKYGRYIAKSLMPETYIVDKQLDLFKRDYQPGKTYILKKNLQRKLGLKLTQNLEEILNCGKDDYRVVQKYIDNPLLIKKRKINLRIYLLIICNKKGKQYYLHKNGKCIYNNKDYDNNDINDAEKHYTSLNLNSEDVYKDRPFSLYELENYYGKFKYNNLRLKLENNIRKLIHAIDNQLCYLHKNNISFQLFGLDYIIDDNYNMYLLEINKGPDMSNPYWKSKEVNMKVLYDIFDLLGLTSLQSKTWNNEFYSIN